MLIYSFFVVIKRVDGVSLLELSFFLFTISIIGLLIRIDENLNVCERVKIIYKKNIKIFLKIDNLVFNI